MKTQLKAKMSRREGAQLSDGNAHAKALVRRPYPPGVHGPSGFRRSTEYGKQLREKQKAKRMYGLSERQFRNTFDAASSKKGNTGEFLIQLLETRLDNAVYRAGFAKTRAAARQLVGHAHFDVNGKKVNIPSYRVRPGEVIAIRQNKREKGPWKAMADALRGKKDVPSWLSIDADQLSVKVTSVPSGPELQQPFDVTLIIEFYSRQ